MALELKPFSVKQLKLLTWWHEDSPVKDAIGIIADGAIRAGKTLSFAISFIEWAFKNFTKENFALCGKTVGSFRRNVWKWFVPLLRQRGYRVKESRSDNLITISRWGKKNYFYIFGGRDESSQDLIQGITLAGVLFDEVALMPESFVNQATGRCSIEGSKFWFNCNPDGPTHWFKTGWIDKAEEKKLIHLHFTQEDNLTLSEAKKEMYRNMYHGVFFKRYILGLWVAAEGAIYDMWNSEENTYSHELDEHTLLTATHWVSIDVGTQNATVFLYIIDDGINIWVEDIYYHSGRDSGQQKTNSQYCDDLEAFTAGRPIHRVVIDPSAAAFKTELKRRGFRVKDADNDVLDGISMTASFIGCRIIKVHKRCTQLIREIMAYVWDTTPTLKGNEKPLKRDDHGPDALRYFIKTCCKVTRLVDFQKWRQKERKLAA